MIGGQDGTGIASIPATITHVLAGTLKADDPADGPHGLGHRVAASGSCPGVSR